MYCEHCGSSKEIAYGGEMECSSDDCSSKCPNADIVYMEMLCRVDGRPCSCETHVDCEMKS